MNPTQEIARFITGFKVEDIPDQALEVVKMAFTDYTISILAGLDEPCTVKVRRMLAEFGGHPQASVWGTDLKTSVTHAAMANGTAAHAQDLDDTNAVMMSHPSIQLLPALFALGEYHRSSGRELVQAYLVGFEFGAMLGRAMNPEFVAYGWFPVGPFGVMMQTAACAKLLKLTPDQVENALGIAANLASGIRSNNGTMAKPFAPGHAAADAVMAVTLAKDGMTANTKALESQFGFIDNFSRNKVERLEEAVATLGDPLEILQSGLSYKLYPCCAGTHTAIDCALEIVKNQEINAEEIEEIAVHINPGVQFLLIHPRPNTEMEAKFSLDYCVARAVLDRDIGPEQFTAPKLTDPALKSLIEKVKPCWEDTRMMDVKIEIKMNNGQSYNAEVAQARGMTDNPLEWSDLEGKFLKYTTNILTDENARKALKLLQKFEKLTDISEMEFIKGTTKI
jgi:2-methylcitrate dehydratase PrpD